MPDWQSITAAVILALPIASVMTASQLIHSEYPNTWFLFTPRKSKAFYAYCFLYGVVALVVTLVFGNWIAIESPWWRAVIVGLAARSLVQISIYDIPAGARTIPVGPAIVLQVWEPWMLNKIQQDEDSELRRFVRNRAQKYPDLNDVRQRTKGAPHSLPEPERLAFEADIDDTGIVEEAMEKHIKYLGRKSFNTAFPAS